MREIRMLQRRDHDQCIRFVDVAAGDFDAAAAGSRPRAADGRMVSTCRPRTSRIRGGAR
jgi:hypothetical protein